MNASLFLEYIDKYFRLVVGKITEKFNDAKQEQPLLHKSMLTEEYSADLTRQQPTPEISRKNRQRFGQTSEAGLKDAQGRETHQRHQCDDCPWH